MKMPARVLLAAVLALVALPSGTASAGTQSCPGAGAVPTARTLDDARDATVCLLNRERTKRGLRALRTNGVLQSSATSYAQDMVRRNFFAHHSGNKDEGSILTFLERYRQCRQAVKVRQ